MLAQNQTDKEIGFKSPSNKASLIGVLGIVLTIAAFIFFVRPLGSDVAVVKADVMAKSDEVEKLKTQLESLKASEDALNLTTEVSRLETLKAVPSKINQDQVIRDLIEIAKTYDVNLNSISFSKGFNDQEGIGTLRVSSSFEGDYTDLMDFLEGLEQNARVFKVDSISVQVSKLDISDVERANFSLSIETFFQQ